MNCDYPDASELVGYDIMRIVSQAPGDCSTTLLPENPVQNSEYLAGQTSVSTSPVFIDSGLTNGVTYCYRVHAFDAAYNFSRSEPPPGPYACTPADTQPPATPTITLPITYSQTSCSPSWGAVTDNDPVTYTLYRCNNTPDSCAAGSFTNLTGDPSVTPCAENPATCRKDTGVSGNHFYTYCVTAKDAAAAPNESGIIGGANASINSPNCWLCDTWPVPDPPTGVRAARETELPASNFGARINFTKSTDDDEPDWVTTHITVRIPPATWRRVARNAH